MRKKLAAINEERKRFTGIFVRFGKKSGWKGRSEDTLMLRDICDATTQQRVTDHLWFNVTKEFDALNLKPGQSVEFDARSKQYTKGYVNKLGSVDNRKYDYKLSHPTKVAKVSKTTEAPDPNQISKGVTS
jgi:hypothetical protein